MEHHWVLHILYNGLQMASIVVVVVELLPSIHTPYLQHTTTIAYVYVPTRY